MGLGVALEATKQCRTEYRELPPLPRTTGVPAAPLASCAKVLRGPLLSSSRLRHCAIIGIASFGVPSILFSETSIQLNGTGVTDEIF